MKPFLLSMILCFTSAYGQDLKHPLANDNPINSSLVNGDYISPLGHIERLRASYSQSKYSSLFPQVEANYNLFVGNYSKTIILFDSLQAKWVKVDTSKIGDFAFAKSFDAHDYIVTKSQDYRAIFINESHFMPQQRAFVESLLKPLYQQGFRYFACEMLNPEDSLIMNRGFALQNKSGFYINEPIFGQLIREAIKLGFTLITYEDTANCEKRKDDPLYCTGVREKNQALNLINQTLARDSVAKIVAFAGYQHIHEQLSSGFPVKPMAQCFKELSGKEVLTIDQTMMIEHSSKFFESNCYIFATDERKITKPTIFLLKDTAWVGNSKVGLVDLQVFFPRTILSDGRPNWLLSSRFVYKLPSLDSPLTYPYLVQAYYKNEPDDAIPVDQVLVDSDRPYALLLPKGDFRIRILNKDGSIKEKHDCSIK